MFWVAQSLSYTGSQVSELAIPLTAALVLGAGAGQMGVLSAAELLPPLALGLLIGGCARRSLPVATVGPMLAAVAAGPVSRGLGTERAQVAAAAVFAGNFLIPLAGGPLWIVVLL